MDPIIPPICSQNGAVPHAKYHSAALTFAQQPISAPPVPAIASETPNGPSATKPAVAVATDAETVPGAPDASSHAHTVPPYSPTKTELDGHPIVQRLSVHEDGIATEAGKGQDTTTSIVPAELVREAKPQELLVKEVEHKGADVIMGDTSIKEGDAVSYAWGGDKKGGTVTEVATSGSVTMETARGNTASKDAKPDDPALRLERAGHDVVKNASEVSKEKAGETHNEGGVHKTVGTDVGTNGEAKTGEKRGAEHVEESKTNGAEEEPPAKKKKGRPAKNGAGGGAAKKERKRPPKKAATESGEPRRSGRVAAKSS